MEFRNETVKEITHRKGRPDQYTHEDTYNIKVECHPGKDERYGNRYSGFFKDSVISKLFGGLSEGDFVGKNVRIGFTWREYEDNQGVTKKARELKTITIRDMDVNDDIQPGDEENPLLTPVSTPGDSTVSSEHPVLGPESASKPRSNEKQGEGKGEGRIAPIDAKERRISRLSLSNHAANLVAPNGDKFDSFDQMFEAYERIHIAMCEREGVE